MFKIYYSPLKGRDKLIATVCTQDLVWAVITTYIKKELKYTPHYYRTFQTNYKGKLATEFDYGSHVSFFYVVNV